MKKKLLFLVAVLAFMVAMPIASAEVLESKDVTTLVEMVLTEQALIFMVK